MAHTMQLSTHAPPVTMTLFSRLRPMLKLLNTRA